MHFPCRICQDMSIFLLSGKVHFPSRIWWYIHFPFVRISLFSLSNLKGYFYFPFVRIGPLSYPNMWGYVHFILSGYVYFSSWTCEARTTVYQDRSSFLAEFVRMSFSFTRIGPCFLSNLSVYANFLFLAPGSVQFSSRSCEDMYFPFIRISLFFLPNLSWYAHFSFVRIGPFPCRIYEDKFNFLLSGWAIFLAECMRNSFLFCQDRFIVLV